MALTIEYALKHFEVLAPAKVVAGLGGLQREIRWAHIVDLPDVSPWVRAGDLLLTTAFALKDDPEAQARLIPVLVEKGLSGLVVALGTYFKNIPDSMIELANQFNIPIITLPWEVPFVDVTRAIYEHILREQYIHIDKSLHIHDVLTRSVLEGKDLHDIVHSLAELLNRSVTIEDPSLRVLAHASPGPVDEMRQRSISEGRTPVELVSYLERKGVLDRLRRDPQPMRVPSMPEIGMTYERILAPIIVGEQLLGYVWIIATEEPLSELDFLAIQQAAMVAALTFTRQQAVNEAEQRVKSNLLDNLLEIDENQDLRSLRETLRQLGLQAGFQVMILEEVEGGDLGVGNGQGASELAQIVQEELTAEGLSGTTIQRAHRLVLLLGTPDREAGLTFTRNLVEIAKQQGICLIIGVGRAKDEVVNLRHSYSEAGEALRLGKVVSLNQPAVWPFESLGFLYWLQQVPGEILADSSYQKIIQEIAEYDLDNNTQFLNTLEASFDYWGNKQKASEVLFLHRNTLRFRLEKIESLWKLNLEQAFVRANLYIAIKLWRYQQKNILSNY